MGSAEPEVVNVVVGAGLEVVEKLEAPAEAVTAERQAEERVGVDWESLPRQQID